MNQDFFDMLTQHLQLMTHSERVIIFNSFIPLAEEKKTIIIALLTDKLKIFIEIINKPRKWEEMEEPAAREEIL